MLSSTQQFLLVVHMKKEVDITSFQWAAKSASCTQNRIAATSCYLPYLGARLLQENKYFVLQEVVHGMRNVKRGWPLSERKSKAKYQYDKRLAGKHSLRNTPCLLEIMISYGSFRSFIYHFTLLRYTDLWILSLPQDEMKCGNWAIPCKPIVWTVL